MDDYHHLSPSLLESTLQSLIDDIEGLDRSVSTLDHSEAYLASQSFVEEKMTTEKIN